MATVAGTLETLALELGHALAPLADLLDPESLLNLGTELPRSLATNPGLLAALTATHSTVTDLESKTISLGTAIAGGDVLTIITAGKAVTTGVSGLIAQLTSVGTALSAAAAALPPAERGPLQDLAGKLAGRVLEALLISYLRDQLPSLMSTLAVIGLVDMTPEPSPTLDVRYGPRDPVAPRLHLDRLQVLLQHPDQYLQQTFKWGASDFDGVVLLRKVQDLLESFGLSTPIYQRPDGSHVLEAFAFALGVDRSVSPPGLTLELSLPGNATLDQAIAFTPMWKGTVHTDAHFAAGLSATLRPPFALRALPPSGSVTLDTRLGLAAETTAEDPIVLLGVTGGTRLTARRLSAEIGAKASLDAAGGDVTPIVQLRLDEGRLVVDFSEGDGFIQTLLAGVHLDAQFGLVADWSPTTGLRLQGQGGVEVFVPLHIDLAVVLISGLYVSITLGSPAPLSIVLATQLTTTLGPLTAIVDRIGMRTAIGFPAGGGNLGVADLAFAFQPPRGVGLSIDGGALKGGGFLSLDAEKGEYIGALEFSFQDVVTLKAIGIINTKLPDGSKGFALLILITAEFVPIQLGFGFTLIGVGGLLALNRTLDLDALRTGVRTGAVNSILFPQDVIANIARIISDLKTIFPLARDHFIIGPMGKLGWGTPTLISLEIGVILDLPRPMFVIVGVLRCILPAEDAPILKLQVNFAGGVDFEAGRIWFDASLFDSRLLVYTLTGDMALRINWGDDSLFVLSVGGFHPAFKEVPTDLRAMRRVSISLLSGENPRLAVQTYFAVTSNTVQSGSKVELYAAACGFNIYGFLGYDLLVQFNPFRFVAQIQAGLALRRGTSVIAGISARVQLTGPTPWRARGEASLEFLFFEITVDFDVTWGEEAGQIEQTVDVYPLLKAAVLDDRNWMAELPVNSRLGVTQRTPTVAPNRIVVQPFGRLAVSQKVVPLGLEITTFGNKRPVGATRFDLAFADGVDVREEFAVASFVRLSDSDKLSRKSFERMRSGISFTPDSQALTGASVAKQVDYELSYVQRSTGTRIDAGRYRLGSAAFATLSRGGAIARSSRAVATRAGGTPPVSVGMREPEFRVVNVSDLTLHAPHMTARSEAEAYLLQQHAVAQNPGLAGRIQVMSADELG